MSGARYRAARWCAGGQPCDGALALAWSGLQHIGCVVSVGAELDSRAFGERVEVFSRQPATSLSSVIFTASDAQLHLEVPAIFGVPGSDQLIDPAQWASRLPSKVMLAYDMERRLTAQYAAESSGFRAAVKAAGKDLTYYADTRSQDADFQSQERLWTAVLDYVHSYFGAAGG